MMKHRMWGFFILAVCWLTLAAAPVLASVLLLGRYIVRKMFDRDPWVPIGEELKPVGFPWISKFFKVITNWWNSRKRAPDPNK